MKKLASFFMATALLCSIGANAQTVSVPNGGFENWSGSEAQQWTTAISGNILVEIFGMQVPMPLSAHFGTATTDAHSGSKALKLTAQTIGIPSTDYSYMMPGIAQLGLAGEFEIPLSALLELSESIDSLDFSDVDYESLSTLARAVSPGDSCSKTPTALRLWVKYLPQDGDEFSVIATTKQNGMPVSYAEYTSDETFAEYTQITIPFDNPGAACDSMMLIIVSGGMSTHAATELYVDDVELDYSAVGVCHREEIAVSVYPNPAVDRFVVRMEESAPYNWQLVDMSGRIVAEQADVTGSCSVSTVGIAKGVYLLKIRQGDSHAVREIVVQ